MSSRPCIIVTEPLTTEAIDWLGARAQVRIIRADEAEFSAALQDASGLIVRTYTQVDQAMLEAAPHLKVVGRAGTGLDNIDTTACEARGIAVVNTPEANRQAVVEYVLSLLFHHFRPIPAPVTMHMDEQAWRELRRDVTMPIQLDECVIGILGLGGIGQRVAQVLTAIGCRVQFNDVERKESAQMHGAESVDVDTLLHTSDVLTVHVDGREENQHFLNQTRLAMLPPHALLINTSRGHVIDEHALARTLHTSPGQRAFLDVHACEPIESTSPLLGCDQLRLLPHAASRTWSAH